VGLWAVVAGAELILDDDLRAAHGLWGTMTPQIEAALERMGIPLRGVLGMKRVLRVRERLIVPGEPIFALGLAERAAGQLRLCSTQAAPLIVANRSERKLLRNLYWQVGTSVFWALVAVIIIGWVMAGGQP
jgi:hypothetical protein